MEVINNSVQVKIAFNEDLRRVSIPRNASFHQLATHIVQLFSIAPTAKFVVKYVDNDKDQITMSSDVELREAVNVAQDGIMRLSVSIKDPVPDLVALPTAHSADIEDLTHRSPALVPFFPPSRFGVGFPSQGPFPPHPVFHGPFRGGRRHQHHRAVGPFEHPAHHDVMSPDSQGPHPCRDKSMWKHAKEERKMWKHEQCKLWKEQKKAWRSYWESLSKEERDQLKEQKKDLKRQWKTEAKANLGGQSCTVRLIARHVKDVSIADGTELPPNAPFVKTWRLRNAGEHPWPAGSSLLFISRKGDRMGAPDKVTLEGVVAPNQEVDVSVPMCAPAEPGRYTSYFRMITPEGVKFGQRVWASIMVTGASSSSSSSDETEIRYGSTAEMIEAMGFDVKRKRIVRMLGKHDGDVDKVVKILTKRTKALQL